MKVIQFRAWDKLAKAMSPEFSLFGEFTLLGAVHEWQWEVLQKSPKDASKYDSLGRLNDLEIMQFTGLKDKNGKEIYEGDIMSSSGVKLVVTFEDGKFCFDNTGGSYGRDFIGQDRVGRLEVIGNVYETHELLKQ